jgi:hypothetical protein
MIMSIKSVGPVPWLVHGREASKSLLFSVAARTCSELAPAHSEMALNVTDDSLPR